MNAPVAGKAYDDGPCPAVATVERRLVLTALVAYLVSAVPHLLFDAGHLAPLTAASAAGFMALLGVAVVLPAVLLWAAAREDTGRTRGPEPERAG
ncbi:hypothetical protein [Streptomyces sp. CRN 30]|uniref:hypothetical protein n=1 Tax=Streptomyces sp. CRN 30 TaxID=3075613 RepID=UPI002A838A3D|nr:hypothetical protein [Streptomyces sp. CRN 30]